MPRAKRDAGEDQEYIPNTAKEHFYDVPDKYDVNCFEGLKNITAKRKDIRYLNSLLALLEDGVLVDYVQFTIRPVSAKASQILYMLQSNAHYRSTESLIFTGLNVYQVSGEAEAVANLLRDIVWRLE